MKYLQDDDLARWTAALSSELSAANTSSSVSNSSSSSRNRHLQMSSAMMMAGSGDGGASSGGGGAARRRLQGRLEAYSMKRAGNDKQYAQVLGKKFVEQIHEAQQQLADCKQKHQQQQQDSRQQQKQQFQKVLHRKRSQSAGFMEEAHMLGGSGSSPTKNRKDEPGEKALEGPGNEVAPAAASGRKKEALPAEAMEGAAPCKKRKRAVSFDTAVLGPLRKKKQQGQKHQQQQHGMMMGASVPTGLGDFTEQATRRLMTDLILTLNSSFPDYDFSSTKASDFTAVSVPVAVRRINERLSEWAISSGNNGGIIGGVENDCASSRIHNLWTAVDKSIRLTECQVYAYLPGTGEAGKNATTLLDDSYMEDDDDDDDDDVHNVVAADSDDELRGGGGGGAASSCSSPPIVLWSFYYLFVNKNLKRILLFSCVETMKRQYMAYNNNNNNNYDADDDYLLEDEDHHANGNNDTLPQYYYPSADAADTQDYIDLDPGAPTAGGIPVSSI